MVCPACVSNYGSIVAQDAYSERSLSFIVFLSSCKQSWSHQLANIVDAHMAPASRASVNRVRAWKMRSGVRLWRKLVSLSDKCDSQCRLDFTAYKVAY
jgi:hypothetical protein